MEDSLELKRRALLKSKLEISNAGSQWLEVSALHFFRNHFDLESSQIYQWCGISSDQSGFLMDPNLDSSSPLKNVKEYLERAFQTYHLFTTVKFLLDSDDKEVLMNFLHQVDRHHYSEGMNSWYTDRTITDIIKHAAGPLLNKQGNEFAVEIFKSDGSGRGYYFGVEAYWDAVAYNRHLSYADKLDILLTFKTKLSLDTRVWARVIIATAPVAKHEEIFSFFEDNVILENKGLAKTIWQELILKWSRNPTYLNKVVLGLSSSDEIAESTLRNPYLSPQAIEHLYAVENRRSKRDILASSPAVPSTVLYKWASSRRDSLLAAIARNKNCNVHILTKIIKNPSADTEALSAVCDNPNVKVSLLTPLLVHNSTFLRKKAEDTLRKLKADAQKIIDATSSSLNFAQVAGE